MGFWELVERNGTWGNVSLSEEDQDGVVDMMKLILGGTLEVNCFYIAFTRNALLVDANDERRESVESRERE